MLEIKKNLWDCDGPNTLICITTNGFVKNNGEAVMGRGCAKEAAERWPQFPKMFGEMLNRLGNTVVIWDNQETGTYVENVEDLPDLQGQLATFPVKHNWWEEADLELIKKSAEDLVRLVNCFAREDLPDMTTFEKIYIPRPGCGNGKLSWEIVKVILEPILDDRFIIVDFPND
jgi:hypothetical protein